MERPLCARIPALLLLRDGNYRTLWLTGFLLENARRMELLILSLWVLRDTGSPFKLGLVLVFYTLPRPFISLFAGSFAERFNRHRILVIAQFFHTLTSIAILFLFVGDFIKPWQVFGAIFLQGIARSFDDPSRRTAIFDIVGQSRLVPAMSFETISHTFGRMTGPLIAGVMLGVWGYNEAYIVPVVAHIVNMGLLFRVKIPSTERAGGRGPVWTSLLAAVQYALHTPMLVAILCATMVMNALVLPVHQFIPDIAQNNLKVGAVLIGLLVSSEGYGTLISAVVLAAMRSHRYHGRMFALGSLTFGTMALLFVWSPWYALAFALLAAAGVGQAGFTTMQHSIVMLWSPAEMRGRIIGLQFLCIGLSVPLGTLEIGAVSDAFSTQWAITINILVGLVLFLPILILTPLVRQPSSQPSKEERQVRR